MLKTNRLYELLGLLTAQERKKLLSFIESPFFNTHPKATKLLTYVLPFIPNWESPQLDEYIVFEKIFGEEEFNPQQLNRLRFSCVKLVEEFLVHMELAQNIPEKKRKLLHIYSERNAFRLFEFGYKEWRVMDFPIQDADYFYHQYEVERMVHSLGSKMYEREYRDTSFELAQNNLACFHIISQLEYYAIQVNLASTFHSEGSKVDYTEILRFIEATEKSPAYSKIPIIIFYCIAIKLEISPNNLTYYHELLHHIPLLFEYLDSNARINMYISAANFCIRQIMNGNLQYEQECVKIYKEIIEKNIFSEDIPYTTYKNIVIALIKVEEREECLSFLHEYKKRLSPTVRESVYSLCLAHLYFSQNEFTKVVKLLSMASPVHDIFLNFDIRRMLIKTYYELKEWENVTTQLNSFRVFIHRNKKLTKNNIDAQRTFIKVVEKLMYLMTETQTLIPKNLEQWLKGREKLSDRKWLLTQLEALKNQKASSYK